MNAEALKKASARDLFARSGSFFKMPLAQVREVILAQDAKEGPLVGVPFRALDMEHAENLKNLIKANGFNENSWPVYTFFEGKLYASKGNHRTKALQMLAEEGWDGIEEVKFTIEDHRKTDEDRIIELWTDNAQKGLGMPVQAEVVYELYRITKNKKRVAERLAITEVTVDNMLEYHTQVPTEIKEMVKEEKVAASTALATFREEGRDGEAAKARLAEAFERVIAEQAAKQSKKGRPVKAPKVTEKHLKATRAPKAPVVIPEEFAALVAPQNTGDAEDLMNHMRDLAEIASRALAVLKAAAEAGNADADEVAFELESVLEYGNRKGYAKVSAEAAE